MSKKKRVLAVHDDEADRYAALFEAAVSSIAFNGMIQGVSAVERISIGMKFSCESLAEKVQEVLGDRHAFRKDPWGLSVVRAEREVAIVITKVEKS